MLLLALSGDDARHVLAACARYQSDLAMKGLPVPDCIEEVLTAGRYTSPRPVEKAAGEWLSRVEAARMAGVSDRTVDRWRGDGLASQKVGGVVRIHRDDLNHFLSGQG